MKINLEEILDEFNSFTGSLRKIKEPQLVSFSFNLQNIDALLLIDKLNEFSSDIFLFRTPNDNLAVYGLNSALELTSERINNFTSLADSYINWKKNFVSNWSERNNSNKLMLCCSAKFDNVNSTEEWNDFKTLNVYVPEFILSFQNNKASGCYNFVIDSSRNLDIITHNLVSFLGKLSTINDGLVQAAYQKATIQSKLNSKELEQWKEIAEKALNELNEGSVKKLVYQEHIVSI